MSAIMLSEHPSNSLSEHNIHLFSEHTARMFCKSEVAQALACGRGGSRGQSLRNAVTPPTPKGYPCA
jgi:hypothetical protein